MQNKEDWWTHYCFKQKDHMSFLKEDECDWCGERYHPETRHAYARPYRWLHHD